MNVTVDCPACGCPERRRIMSFEDGLGLAECSCCGFVYTCPRPSAKDLAGNYGSAYQRGHASNPLDYTANDEVFRGDAAERLRLLKKHLPDSGARVLEIGCSAGYFLDECRKAGFKAAGVEISPEMCRLAEQKFGIRPQCGNFEDIEFRDEKFDAVAMWHVFEHMGSPVDVLGKIHRITSGAGLLLMTVPDFRSALSSRGTARMAILQPDVHMCHYTEKTLLCVVGKAGFRIVEVQHDAGTGLAGGAGAVPGPLGRFVSRNFAALSFIRKPLKRILVGLLGRSDFITIVARKA